MTSNSENETRRGGTLAQDLSERVRRLRTDERWWKEERDGSWSFLWNKACHNAALASPSARSRSGHASSASARRYTKALRARRLSRAEMERCLTEHKE